MAQHLATTSDTHVQSEDFPDFDDAGLAARLRQSISTIRSWRSRDPQKLPPGVRIGRVWLYGKKATEDWLIARYAPSPSALLGEQPIAKTSRKRRGKPSNAEVSAANRAGLTVPTWRAQQDSLQSTEENL